MNSFSVSNAMDHKIYQYKIILLGDIAVGKTCVLSRFMNNTFTNIYKCNVGVDYRSKTVTFDNKIGYELNIWDTCGEERFRSVSRQYYKDANAVLLIFDLTNRESFDGLQRWFTDIQNFSSQNIEISVLSNKSDETDKRSVNIQEINELLKGKENCMYFEVSAKTGNNIMNVFETLVKKLNSKEGNEQFVKIDRSTIIEDNKTRLSKGGKRDKAIKKKEACC